MLFALGVPEMAFAQSCQRIDKAALVDDQLQSNAHRCAQPALCSLCSECRSICVWCAAARGLVETHPETRGFARPAAPRSPRLILQLFLALARRCAPSSAPKRGRPHHLHPQQQDTLPDTSFSQFSLPMFAILTEKEWNLQAHACTHLAFLGTCTQVLAYR